MKTFNAVKFLKLLQILGRWNTLATTPHYVGLQPPDPRELSP